MSNVQLLCIARVRLRLNLYLVKILELSLGYVNAPPGLEKTLVWTSKEMFSFPSFLYIFLFLPEKFFFPYSLFMFSPFASPKDHQIWQGYLNLCNIFTQLSNFRSGPAFCTARGYFLTCRTWASFGNKLTASKFFRVKAKGEGGNLASRHRISLRLPWREKERGVKLACATFSDPSNQFVRGSIFTTTNCRSHRFLFCDPHQFFWVGGMLQSVEPLERHFSPSSLSLACHIDPRFNALTGALALSHLTCVHISTMEIWADLYFPPFLSARASFPRLNFGAFFLRPVSNLQSFLFVIVNRSEPMTGNSHRLFLLWLLDFRAISLPDYPRH